VIEGRVEARVEDAAPLLAVTGVAKSYGPVTALRSVDLTVSAGETHALLGANGAGKSTLVKILSGVVGSDTGTIAVQGRPVDIRRPGDAARHRIATVHQDPALVPDLTVRDNLRMTGLSESAVRDWLLRLDLPDVDFGDLVHDLPLARQRMLDLARALSTDPLVLLLDEITATLPADLAERVFAVMAQWKQSGRSVLFISHRLAEVLAHCEQATVLRDGHTVARFAPREGGERRMVQAMLGEALAVAPPAAAARPAADAVGPVVLSASDLHLGRHLHGVSLEVRAGEILGISALEDQGQAPLFDVLSGNRRADRGVVAVGGTPYVARSPYDAIRRGVVLVPSDRLQALLPQRSVAENLATALHNRPRRWGLIDRGAERQRVGEAISRLSIDTRAQSEVRRLSGGNQQKVTIGRWLAAGFGTLLCFDPTRGIDVGTKRQIYDLLRELAASGAAILLYTSELREIPLVCDRVIVLYDGRVVWEQPAATADEETLLTAAHGLERDEAAV